MIHTHESHKRSSLTNRIAGLITDFAGSMTFVYIHIVWFLAWVVINAGIFVAILPWDGYPYQLLTLAVSLEAILLSTFVMIAQNRQAIVADKRAEADYEVNLKAEKEISELLEIVRRIEKQDYRSP